MPNLHLPVLGTNGLLRRRRQAVAPVCLTVPASWGTPARRLGPSGLFTLTAQEPAGTAAVAPALPM